MTPRKLSNRVAAGVATEIIAIRDEGLLAAYAPVATASIESKSLPVYQLPDLATLRINCSPFSRASTPASRSSREQELSVLIMVTMRTLANADLFPQLIDLVNDLDDLLSDRYLIVDGCTISWTGSEANPIYDIDTAYEQKVFRALIQVNYQAFVN